MPDESTSLAFGIGHMINLIFMPVFHEECMCMFMQLNSCKVQLGTYNLYMVLFTIIILISDQVVVIISFCKLEIK